MNRREILALSASMAALWIFPPLELLPINLAAGAIVQGLVVVVKQNGKAVKGTMVSYDPNKITLDVVGKLKDPPVRTDIPWTDIKHISNGLTRKRAIEEWKGAHHDKLCLTCHGNQNIFCPVCHGTNHDPASSANCPRCKGAAEIACNTLHCNHGIIPCTNHECLKLSDPGWYTKPGGSHWKKFTVAGGWFEWSDHHLGQVIHFDHGTYVNLGTCPICGGTTTIWDTVCLGTSKRPCPICVARKAAPICPNKCQAGLVQCPTCNGSGLKA